MDGYTRSLGKDKFVIEKEHCWYKGRGGNLAKYAIEGDNRKAKDIKEIENYWDKQREYLKIVYRDVRVNYHDYIDDRLYPHNSGEIDFSKNNEVSAYDWGEDLLKLSDHYSLPYYSRISNPHFSYVLEFLNYCSYWRIANDYPNEDLYRDLENLIPGFVKEYKKK